MEKLTLENIACYLPYELKILGKDGIIGTMVSEFGIESPEVTIGAVIRNNGFYTPILRPMSDLTKPIKLQGYDEPVTLLVELAKIAFPERNWKMNGIISMNEKGFHFWYNSGFIKVHGVIHYFVPNQWELFQFLAKHKFDFQNLIEKSLAIDVNTLETNPYNN